MKKKKLIVLIIILIILVIVALISLKYLNKQQENIEISKENNPELYTLLDIQDVQDENEFFIINNCVNEFLLAENENDNKRIFNMLDEEYKKEYGISSTNVLEKVNLLNGEFSNFFASKISYREISFQQKYQYYVYGKIFENDYKDSYGVYIIVNLDFVNNSFSVQFDKEFNMEEEDYNKTLEKIKKGNTGESVRVADTKEAKIELNEYNEFSNTSSDKPLELEEYLKYYTVMAVYFPEFAYNNLLDENYKNAKFKNYEEYEEYIKNNKNMILSTAITSYNTYEKEDYKEYFICDTNENYYIFKVKGIMDYTVIADFYTIDLEQITDKYDSGSEQEKVAINIQKVISAIKDRDYEYVYNKLNESFKNANYESLEKFEKTMQEIYTGKMKLTFKEFSNEGNTYIYNINLKGTTASNNREVNMQIIMQLKENRDFVMSFSIK